MLNGYLALGNAQFEIRYGEGDHRFAQEVFGILSQELPSLTDYFLLQELFPKVRVVLVINRNEYDRLVRELLRVEVEGPSSPYRIAQPQRTDMVVLSPSAYESHSVYHYDPGEFRRLLIHELVHMLEEHLSPDIEASPRWWSEGLAVYLSEQWRYEDVSVKTVLDAIAKNNIPGFSQIEAENRLAYDWGWTIVRFMESSYGKEMILRMVRESTDGNVFSVIGETAEVLEKKWKEWLFEKESLFGQAGG
jgi:hypothetical protein